MELELVLPIYNHDRTKCKIGSRDHYGGCNALQSRHPFHLCLLRLPFTNFVQFCMIKGSDDTPPVGTDLTLKSFKRHQSLHVLRSKDRGESDANSSEVIQALMLS